MLLGKGHEPARKVRSEGDALRPQKGRPVRMVATLKDVARHAGVSIQSVSNVINGRESQMREDTRDRILQAIRDLDYQPHSQARALRSHRTDTVAFLTIDPVMRFLSTPFHVEVVSGMVETLRLHDY